MLMQVRAVDETVRTKAPFHGGKSSDTVEDIADAWLAEWAYWTKNPGNLYYPRRSVTERAQEGGITAGSPRPPTEMPDEAAKTDRAVASLGLRHKSILRRVIRLKYEKHLVDDTIASDLGCTVAAVRALVKRAQRAVYSYRINLN